MILRLLINNLRTAITKLLSKEKLIFPFLGMSLFDVSVITIMETVIENRYQSVHDAILQDYPPRSNLERLGNYFFDLFTFGIFERKRNEKAYQEIEEIVHRYQQEIYRLDQEEHRDLDDDAILQMVMEDGMSLQKVRQTHTICLAGVMQNGLALMHVREQTNEICLAAVRQNINASQYVRRNQMTLIEDDAQLNQLFNENISGSASPIPRSFRDMISNLLKTHIDSETRECGICFEETPKMGYRCLPCNHDLTCLTCISKLQNNVCPFCRAEITGVTRI